MPLLSDAKSSMLSGEIYQQISMSSVLAFYRPLGSSMLSAFQISLR